MNVALRPIVNATTIADLQAIDVSGHEAGDVVLVGSAYYTYEPDSLDAEVADYIYYVANAIATGDPATHRGRWRRIIASTGDAPRASFASSTTVDQVLDGLNPVEILSIANFVPRTSYVRIRVSGTIFRMVDALALDTLRFITSGVAGAPRGTISTAAAGNFGYSIAFETIVAVTPNAALNLACTIGNAVNGVQYVTLNGGSWSQRLTLDVQEVSYTAP